MKLRRTKNGDWHQIIATRPTDYEVALIQLTGKPPAKVKTRLALLDVLEGEQATLRDRGKDRDGVLNGGNPRIHASGRLEGGEILEPGGFCTEDSICLFNLIKIRWGVYG